MSALELYEFPPTRSDRARWALEELGVEYERINVALTAGEQEQPAYRSVHPLGVVPALRSENYLMFESVAIVMQLIDEHPECGLAPPTSAGERAAYYQWCVFAAAELDPVIMQVFDNTLRPLEFMRPAGAKHEPTIAERGRWAFARRADMLSQVLAAQVYLLGDTFSGADICVGHSLYMAQHVGLINDYSVLTDYWSRLAERPAHQRVYASD